MKKILHLTCIILFLLSSSLFGQTTVEEYNYVTKGYKVQIESGLDMKKGYSIEDIGYQSTDLRTVALKVLNKIKPDGTKKIAAYMIVYTREGIPAEYICVPHPNSSDDIMNAYWEQLYNGSGDSSYRLQLIAYIISTKICW